MYKNIYTLLAIISLLSGLLLIFIGIYFLGSFLAIIPTFIIYYFVYKKKSGKYIKYGFLPIITLLIICITPFLFAGEFIYRATTPITANWKYESKRNDFSKNIFVNHFPQEIDKRAENVKFFYLPKFLQGGEYFILKEDIPTEKYEKIYASYISKKNQNLEFPNFLFKDFSYLRVIDEPTENYEIIPLYAEHYGDDDYWNHGRISGIAFRKTTNTIVYWYEFW